MHTYMFNPFSSTPHIYYLLMTWMYAIDTEMLLRKKCDIVKNNVKPSQVEHVLPYLTINIIRVKY